MTYHPRQLARTALALAVGASLALAGATTASAAADAPTASAADEVVNTSPVIQDAADLGTQTAAIEGNTVAVKGQSSEIRVTLPVSGGADSETDEGLVELSEDSSSSIVPVVLEDGSVAIHSVLNDANAPTTYDYAFDLPEGAVFELDLKTGGVTALNTDGTPALYVAPPWATDATGAAVPTHYSVNGDTITQHIEVDANTAFPVVADPWAGIDLVSSFYWTWVSGAGWKINIAPTPWARGYTGNPWWVSVGNAGWDELYNKVPSTQRSRLNESGKGQYVCHMGFAGFDAEWNLELWKPAKSIPSWVASQCN